MTMEEFFLSVLASLVATLIAGLVRKWLDSSSLASIGKAPRIGEALISPGVLFCEHMTMLGRILMDIFYKRL